MLALLGVLGMLDEYVLLNLCLVCVLGVREVFPILGIVVGVLCVLRMLSVLCVVGVLCVLRMLSVLCVVGVLCVLRMLSVLCVVCMHCVFCVL